MVAGRNGNHFKIFGLGLSADEVVLYLDVLCAIVELWVVHHADGTVIVTVKRRWSGLTASQLVDNFSEPNVVAAGVTRCLVFRFGRRLGNWLLKT